MMVITCLFTCFMFVDAGNWGSGLKTHQVTGDCFTTEDRKNGPHFPFSNVIILSYNILIFYAVLVKICTIK